MRLFYEVQRRYEPVAEPPKIARNSLPYDREFPITHSLCARRGCLSAEGARELHASLEREANASVTVPKVVDRQADQPPTPQQAKVSPS